MNGYAEAMTKPHVHIPDAGPRQRKALVAAREQGALDVLEEFIPQAVETIRRRQELAPKVLALLEGCIRSGDTAGIKDVTPLLKAFFDEDKRLMDRVVGSAVQRSASRSEVDVRVEARVVHTSLRELVEGRARQQQETIEGDAL